MDGHGPRPGPVYGQLDLLALQPLADKAFRIVTGHLLEKDVPHLVVAAQILDLVNEFVFLHNNQPFGRFASAQIGMKVCRQTAAFLVE